VALSQSGDAAPSVLLRCADIAMYQAKTLGPGRYVIYEEHDEGDAGRSLRMSNELHRASGRTSWCCTTSPTSTCGT